MSHNQNEGDLRIELNIGKKKGMTSFQFLKVQEEKPNIIGI